MRTLNMRSAPILVFLASMFLLGTWTGMANAQPNATYQDFDVLTDATSVQIQLTYSAPLQDEALAPVLYVVQGQTANPAGFVPFERPDIIYASLDVVRTVKEITEQQMRQIIDAAGTVPSVVSGGVSANPWLSVAMLNNGANLVAEAVLDQTEALALVEALGSVVEASNHPAFRALIEFACAIGTIGSQVPTDVTLDVGLQLTGLRLDRATGNFVGLLTVTNSSGTGIAGPISIGFMFTEPNLSLANKTGTTCATTPPGIEYLDVDVTGGELAPEASIDVKIELANPELRIVVPTYKVLAGAGLR